MEKPKKDRIDGVDIMRLVNACGINSVRNANDILTEIEAYQYMSDVDNQLVMFFREKIDSGELNQIAQKYSKQ